MRYLPFVLTACLLIGALHPVHVLADGTDMPREARLALSKAAKAMESDKPADAMHVLEEYLAAKPESVPAAAYLMLGNLRFESDNAKGAARVYADGLAAHPEHGPLCLNLAIVRAEQERHKDAARLFERAYGLVEPANPRLLFQAAASWYRLGEFAAAETTLDRLLATDAEIQPQWVELMARCCLENKHAAKAERALEQLVALRPGEARFWRTLGRVKMERDDYAGAAAALEAASHVETPKAAVLKELAGLYRYLDAPLRAASTLERISGPAPDDPKILDDLFEAYSLALRSEPAMAAIDRAIRLEPTAKRHMRKGAFLFDQERYADARKAFAAALALEPDNPDAHMQAGYCALELDDLDAANEAFARAARTPSFRKRAQSCLNYVGELAAAREKAEAERHGSPS